MKSKLKDIIRVNEAKPPKEIKKEMLPIKVQVKAQNELSFFDYKTLKATTKRRNSNTNTLMIKKSKKHSNTWIKERKYKAKNSL